MGYLDGYVIIVEILIIYHCCKMKLILTQYFFHFFAFTVSIRYRNDYLMLGMRVLLLSNKKNGCYKLTCKLNNHETHSHGFLYTCKIKICSTAMFITYCNDSIQVPYFLHLKISQSNTIQILFL